MIYGGMAKAIPSIRVVGQIVAIGWKVKYTERVETQCLVRESLDVGEY